MGQVFRGSVMTTYATGAAIQRSQVSIKELSKQYGLDTKADMKWTKRDVVEDASMEPKEARVTAVETPRNRRLVRAYGSSEQSTSPD